MKKPTEVLFIATIIIGCVTLICLMSWFMLTYEASKPLPTMKQFQQWSVSEISYKDCEVWVAHDDKGNCIGWTHSPQCKNDHSSPQSAYGPRKVNMSMVDIVVDEFQREGCTYEVFKLPGMRSQIINTEHSPRCRNPLHTVISVKPQ